MPAATGAILTTPLVKKIVLRFPRELCTEMSESGIEYSVLLQIPTFNLVSERGETGER